MTEKDYKRRLAAILSADVKEYSRLVREDEEGTIRTLGLVAVIWRFYVRQPSIEPAAVNKMAYPLPDKSSIAVLPFVNMSDDPGQEYFCDGITQEQKCCQMHPGLTASIGLWQLY